MILICLPYAGGSKAVYYNWKGKFNNNIKLEPIELKGRGSRYSEGYYTDLEDAVNDIYLNIKDKIINEEYAIFGHSMGSLLAFELYYKILESGGRIPKHIFFSGYMAPHCENKDEIIHDLPDDEFISKVLDFGGTPTEVSENKDILELAIPILRNDFKIVELYKYKHKSKPIQCDITILNGREDTMTPEELNGWKLHSTKNVNICTFEGNHFFIDDNLDEIIKLIESALL